LPAATCTGGTGPEFTHSPRRRRGKAQPGRAGGSASRTEKRVGSGSGSATGQAPACRTRRKSASSGR
jgi:hypothetical protein